MKTDETIEQVDVAVRVGRTILHGTLAIPGKPKGIVLYAHGAGSSRFSPRKVYLVKTEGSYEIPEIQLETEADIPDIDPKTFNQLAEQAKDNCIISKLLRTADIRLSAKLLSREKA